MAAQEKYELELTIPIMLQGKLIGFLALGAKKSGDDFSDEDIGLLKTVSAQAAVAIEKARLYDKVKNYSAELEQEVKRRTAKIEGLQKEQKQMMLEIAHGLQTPLTIARSELEAITQDGQAPRQIASASSNLERISKFIYDMLRLAKMESGGGFEHNILDLSAALSDLVESYEIIAAEKGIKIRSDISPGLKVRGDRARLEEMITNLASNAVKYIGADNRDKKISIMLKKAGREAVLSIRDNGIGVSSEDQKKLFTRFYRSGRAQESGQRGTGLGLMIAREIALKHGGRIELESAVGQGSTFRVLLPLEQ